MIRHYKSDLYNQNYHKKMKVTLAALAEFAITTRAAKQIIGERCQANEDCESQVCDVWSIVHTCVHADTFSGGPVSNYCHID